jgi:hypothetical protein
MAKEKGPGYDETLLTKKQSVFPLDMRKATQHEDDFTPLEDQRQHFIFEQA